MTPEEKLKRGREAQLVLDSPAYKDATAKMVSDIRSLRLQLGPRDTEGAYRLVLMEQVVEKARKHLEAYLYDAEQARRDLEKQEAPTPIGRINRLFRR